MIASIRWRGRAVSVNDWHGQGKTRNGGRRIIATTEYKVFMESVAWTIIQQCKLKFKCPSVLLYFRLGPLCDNHNYIKPVMDALQHSGAIENDRKIAWFSMAPPEAHGPGEEDEITIILMGE